MAQQPVTYWPNTILLLQNVSQFADVTLVDDDRKEIKAHKWKLNKG